MSLVPANTPDNPTTGPAPRKLWSVGTLTYTTTGLVILFCWLLWGDFTWSMKDRAILPTMQLLLKKFGASDTFAAVVFGSLPNILGMFVGPIVSYKSDRYRSRWGRRIPFLLASTPFMVLGLIGLAFSPVLGTGVGKWLGLASVGLNTSVLMFFLVFWIILQLASTVSNGLYGALVNDVVPQPLLGRFFGLFRALSLIAGMLFFGEIFGKAETLYVWIFLGLAALYGFGTVLMCLKVKEGEYPPHVPMDEGRSTRGFFATVKTYFQECFGKEYYLWFFGGTTLLGMSGIPSALFGVFYSKSIGMSPDTYGKCVMLTYGISLVLAYPIGWLADRFHPLRLVIVTNIVGCLVAFASYFFVHDVWTFGVSMVASGLIGGTAVTGGASLGQRLLPRAEFAQFASAGGLLYSVSWILLPPLIGIFLDHTHHNYRYTFLMGAYLGFLGSAALLVLHSKFMALGGPKNYVPPE
ncbi:MAG: MFS transporter [Methylacidiphilales bacterium]|nr:MFS transporter [Candidatus Methylacidiphilales bacterium]